MGFNTKSLLTTAPFKQPWKSQEYYLHYLNLVKGMITNSLILTWHLSILGYKTISTKVRLYYQASALPCGNNTP